MKKRKLKPAVKITFILILICISITFVLSKNNSKQVVSKSKEYIYVNDYIFDDYYPVINQEDKIIKPYTSEKVSIANSFYEKDAEKDSQEKSIIYYDGIYMQNSGITYKSDEEFDINTILEGTVTNVSDDTLLGKTVEIKYSNELIIMYQTLNNITVKKGDKVNQGQVIAKSGSCSLCGESKYNLHIEIYKNGAVINPEKIYNKTIKEISEN